jgi:hypothetical protein
MFVGDDCECGINFNFTFAITEQVQYRSAGDLRCVYLLKLLDRLSRVPMLCRKHSYLALLLQHECFASYYPFGQSQQSANDITLAD